MSWKQSNTEKRRGAWAVYFAIALVAVGCAKTMPEAVSGMQEATPQEVICPKHYYFQSDKYVPWNRNEKEGTRCSDGKFYCFGDNQIPQVMPVVSDGYACKSIAGRDLGKFQYEDDEYQQEFLLQDNSDIYIQYPFCHEDNTERAIIELHYGHDRYAWICEEETGCICGEGACPYGAQCYREQCIESEYEYVFSGDIVRAIDKEVDDEDLYDESCDRKFDYYSYRSPMRDGDEDDERSSHMYKCGESWEERLTNRTCIPHPLGDVIKYDFCPNLTEEEWKQYKDALDMEDSLDAQMQRILEERTAADMQNGLAGKEVPWDLRFEKCQCGNERCAVDTGCYQDRCVDLANLRPLPDGFVWNKGRPYCDGENCICGKELCHRGEWCIEDKCFDTRDVLKVDDKYIRYGYYEYSQPRGIDPFFDVETQQALPRDHYPANLNHLIWLDIILHRHSALCDDPVLPEALDDYWCIAAHTDNGCEEAWGDEYAFYGWHCMKEEGCACGEGSCGKNARCYHGHCVYDWIYLVMSCGSDLASGGMSAQADDAGWCKCGASYTPPYLDGYLCRDGLGGDGIGMQCWRKDGCACGDITCPYEGYCAAPGRCVDRDEMVDLYLELERR